MSSAFDVKFFWPVVVIPLVLAWLTMRPSGAIRRFIAEPEEKGQP
jgi:hypothetical protein